MSAMIRAKEFQEKVQREGGEGSEIIQNKTVLLQTRKILSVDKNHLLNSYIIAHFTTF